MHLPLLLISALPLAAVQDDAASVRAWEHESSDLAVNGRMRFGALDNGLRYVWMANPEPDGRSYVRMHVDVGAFAEEDAEDGMAHFLEHMAFNGSENFAAGTLVEWFQEHGMAFGADLNAMTSYSLTVYQLDLPTSDEAMLREGLGVLRDWAGGLLLAAEEVEREKGVIDAEQASGETASRRVFEAILARQYDGTRYRERDVIGDREVRAAFTSESVRRFYERWYRPDLMTLIVVGDLGELDPAPLIEEVLGDLPRPAEPAPDEPAIGAPALAERYFCVYEPELPTVTIHLEQLRLYEEEPDTVATRTRDLALVTARRMLNQRLAELAKAEGASFLGAGVSQAGGLEVYDGESLTVTAAPERWEEAFAACEQELRSAVQFGFRDAELNEVRANWLRTLDEEVEREATRHSAAYVGRLVRAAEDRYVPTDALAERALLRPLIEELEVEECHAALLAAWAAGTRNLFTTGGLDLGEDAAETLKAALKRSREVEVEAPEQEDLAALAYATPAGETGAIVASQHVEDLDAWLFTFENGVRLNVKATDFKERQILLQARVAEGLLTLAPERFAVAWVGSQVMNLAGLGAHSVDELRELTAGRRVGQSFGLANEFFQIGGATTAEDLLLQLELMRAQLADPGWRNDGVRLLRDRVPLMFEQMAHLPGGPLYTEFLPALFHGDLRFIELPAREAIEAVGMDAVRDWLAPHFADGPIELTIVGDLDVEATRDAVARTLGTLPARRERDEHTDRRTVPPPVAGLRFDRAIETEDDKALAFLVFPTADGLEADRRRALRFLGDIVQDRLRIRVREELGAAYSPGASAIPNETFPGVGILNVTATLPPEQTEAFVDATLELVDDLAKNGVTQEEVERLMEPRLASLRDALRTNGYWVTILADAQRRPETLDNARSAEAFYRSLDAEAMSRLAAENLDRAQASVLVVTPEKAGATEASSPAAEGGEDPRD
ncbi:MAG: insulinase family protein [Planctomycetota bacterium]